MNSVTLLNIFVTILLCVNSEKNSKHYLLNLKQILQHIASSYNHTQQNDNENMYPSKGFNEGLIILINNEPKLNTRDVEAIDTSRKSIKPKYIVETEKQKKKNFKVRQQHNERLTEVINFMADHMMATLYFYEEVQRIKKTRTVMDELREMVSFLEKPKNKVFKTAVLNFFNYVAGESVIRQKKRVVNADLNDLTYSILQDPMNDGVSN